LGNMSLGRLLTKVRNQVATNGHSDWVLSVAFSPDGKTLASASRDQTAKLWDVATGAERNTFRGHTNWVECVRFTPDGQTLATASWDKTARLWKVATSQEIARLQRKEYLPENTPAFFAAAYSPDGRLLAVAADNKSVKVYEAATRKLRTVLRGHNDVVAALTFTPDGKTLATGSYDKSIMLWDVTAFVKPEISSPRAT